MGDKVLTPEFKKQQSKWMQLGYNQGIYHTDIAVNVYGTSYHVYMRWLEKKLPDLYDKVRCKLTPKEFELVIKELGDPTKHADKFPTYLH